MNNLTLKGKYGFYRTGTTTAGTASTVTDIAAAGFTAFDGAGGISVYQNGSTGGVFVANSQSTGYYHVYPNGMFTMSHAPYVAGSDVDIDLAQVTTIGVIVDNGKELYALSTQPGRTSLFMAKRMHTPWWCFLAHWQS